MASSDYDMLMRQLQRQVSLLAMQLSASERDEAISQTVSRVLRVWVKQGRPKMPPLKYVKAAFQSTVSDMIRRKKRERRRESAAKEASRRRILPDDPSQTFAEDEEKQFMMRLVRSLPPEDQKVLWLKYVQGFSETRIAKDRNWSVKKVHKEIDRIKLMLQNHIANEQKSAVKRSTRSRA